MANQNLGDTDSSWTKNVLLFCMDIEIVDEN